MFLLVMLLIIFVINLVMNKKRCRRTDRRTDRWTGKSHNAAYEDGSIRNSLYYIIQQWRLKIAVAQLVGGLLVSIVRLLINLLLKLFSSIKTIQCIEPHNFKAKSKSIYLNKSQDTQVPKDTDAHAQQNKRK